MIIKKLKMENFKSHGSTVIEFDTGISIIIGENGAGKSSILEAVNFALFKSHSGKNMDLLIKNESKGLAVELEFIANGKEYLVRRVRGKTRSEPRLSMKEGERLVHLATKDRQVTEEVQKILEMDTDLFLNAVYVKQGEISDLIEKTPSEKKKMIGKLLGIENLENAWKNMQPLISGYEIRKKILKSKIEEYDGLEERYQTKKKEWEETKGQIEEYDKNIGEVTNDLEEKRKELGLLDEKKQMYESINSEIKNNQTILEGLSATKLELQAEIQQINNKESEIARIKPNLDKLEILKELKQHLIKTEQLEADKVATEQTINQINSAKTVLEEKNLEYQGYEKLKKEMKSLEEERRKYEASPVVKNQLLEKKKEQNKTILNSKGIIEETLKKYNQILDIKAETIEDFAKQLNQIKPALETEKNEIKTALDELNKRIASLTYQNQSLKKPIEELENVKNKCPICLSPIDEIKREELIKGYSSDISANETNILNFQSQLRTLNGTKNILDTKLAEIQTINIQLLQEKVQNLHDAQHDLKNVETNLQNLEVEVQKLEEHNAILAEKQKAQENMEGSYQEYLRAHGSLESLGSLHDYLDRLEKIKQNITICAEKIKIIQDKTGIFIHELENEINSLEGAKSRYHILLGEISKKDEIFEKLSLRIEKIEKTRESLESGNKQLEELDYDPEFHEQTSGVFEKIRTKLSSYKENKGVLTGKESELSQVIRELDQKVIEYKENEVRFKSISDYIKLLEFIRDLYSKDKIQRDLRKRSKPLIELRTREFFERFNFDYSDIKIDEDYDIMVYGPSGGNSLDMISGGERIAVALALRLGITQALAGGNLELIMLDEPTIHLDSTRRQELIDLLKRMSIIPQMIIVTHDFDLEEAADNVLRIKKEDGNSYLVKT